jgi:indolepyruvate ferredoxin oxidoreductase beta subunit
MELSESLRALRYLKPGADFIVYGYQWQPTEVMLGKADYPSVDDIRRQARAADVNLFYLDPAELPEGAADNIYLLGACLTHSQLGTMLPVKTVRQAITSRWPKGAERNMLSFDAGLAK